MERIDLEVQKQRALLVGPQFQSAPSVIDWLRSRHYECFFAPTLRESYDLIRSGPFDLILCSNHLPDGEGVKCWGSGTLKPKAFIRLIDEVIAANLENTQPGGRLNGSAFCNLCGGISWSKRKEHDI